MRITRQFLAGFVLSLLLVACSGKDKSSGIDCITRYSGKVLSLWLTAGQLDTIDGIFNKNSLDPTAYEFTYSGKQPIARGAFTGPGILVYAGYYINGLPVFRQSLAFYFDTTGKILGPPNGVWTGPSPDNDTTTRQTLQSLRSIFLNNYKKCTIQGGLSANPPSHPTAPYQDSCLGAMLGYMDESFADLQIPYGTRLVKTWVVCAADQMPFNFGVLPYPSVIVIDSTAQPVPLVLDYP